MAINPLRSFVEISVKINAGNATGSSMSLAAGKRRSRAIPRLTENGAVGDGAGSLERMDYYSLVNPSKMMPAHRPSILPLLVQ